MEEYGSIGFGPESSSASCFFSSEACFFPFPLLLKVFLITELCARRIEMVLKLTNCV